MRLSRANIPLASEDRTHSQAISTYPHNNLAPHFLPGFINLQHFRHSRWRNPVRLSKSGETVRAAAKVGVVLQGQRPDAAALGARERLPAGVGSLARQGARVWDER